MWGSAASLLFWIAGAPASAGEKGMEVPSTEQRRTSVAWVDPPRERPSSWYGESIALSDWITFGLAFPITGVTVALAPESQPATVLAPMIALAPLVFTGPIVHLSHGNPRRALASFALRVGFFSGALIAGYVARAQCSADTGCQAAAMAGTMSGVMLPPTVLDAAAFTDTRRIPDKLLHGARAGGPPVIPSVIVLDDRVSIGLLGFF